MDHPRRGRPRILPASGTGSPQPCRHHCGNCRAVRMQRCCLTPIGRPDHAARSGAPGKSRHVLSNPGHRPDQRYQEAEFRLRFRRAGHATMAKTPLPRGRPCCVDAAILNGFRVPDPGRLTSAARGYRVANCRGGVSSRELQVLTTPATQAVATRASPPLGALKLNRVSSDGQCPIVRHG